MFFTSELASVHIIMTIRTSAALKILSNDVVDLTFTVHTRSPHLSQNPYLHQITYGPHTLALKLHLDGKLGLDVILVLVLVGHGGGRDMWNVGGLVASAKTRHYARS